MAIFPDFEDILTFSGSSKMADILKQDKLVFGDASYFKSISDMSKDCAVRSHATSERDHYGSEQDQ